MRTKLTKITLVAIFAVAMAFTLSCSGSGDDGGDNPPSGGITNGTGSFSGSGAGEKARVYIDDGSNSWVKYTGNIDIKIMGYDESRDEYDYIDAGKIEGGIVKLQLNLIDPKYLFAMNKMIPAECNAPANIKALIVENFRADKDEDRLSIRAYSYEVDAWEGDASEGVTYIYSSGAANINCIFSNKTLNFNLTQGWNEIYFTESCTSIHEECNIQNSTDKNILKHLIDMKWRLDTKEL